MKIYIAQKGDTFWKIAKNNDIDMDILIHSNPQIAKPEMMLPGMKIAIPQKRKHVKNDLKSKSKKKVDKQNTEHDFTENMRLLPYMEIDDTWENAHLPLPDTTVIETKKRPLETEKIPKWNKQTNKVPPNCASAQLFRNNPISIIRNVPRENIPEINLLQTIP